MGFGFLPREFGDLDAQATNALAVVLNQGLRVLRVGAGEEQLALGGFDGVGDSGGISGRLEADMQAPLDCCYERLSKHAHRWLTPNLG